jgi:hypothetical protein
MSALGRYVGRSHQRLVPAFLAAIVLGILGMHALMQHCPTPAHAMAAGSAAAEMTHHSHDALTTAMPVAGSGISFVASTGQPGGPLDDMLMLCAAMLLGAGALLAVLLGRRSDPPIALPRLRPTTWRPLLDLVATGPPPTLAFTVIRC